VNYKVAYHVGETIGLKTKAKVGYVSMSNGCLQIRGEPEISIVLSTIRSIEIFRLHGTARMLKVIHEHGTLYVSVIRYCLFGYYVSVNFFATGQLMDELQGVKHEKDSNSQGNPSLVLPSGRGRMLRVSLCLVAFALLAGARWTAFGFLPRGYAAPAYFLAGLVIVAGLCKVVVRQVEQEKQAKTQNAARVDDSASDGPAV